MPHRDIGRRTSITYPGGSNQVTYGYDNANRLTSVTGWNSNSTTYSYDDAGRMTSTTLPSGTGIISSYVDGLGSTMAIVDSSGNSQKSYTYDVYGEAKPSGGLSNRPVEHPEA